MPSYRREPIRGATYFFTLVTRRRRRLFLDPSARTILREAVASVRRRLPFTIDAWVLLPDHLHTLWTLPTTDADFSKRWGLIKADFTRRMREQEPSILLSASSRWSSPFWQSRFWEHRIRDDRDFEHHFNYIHWNPVKHDLVQRVRDWPWSTFHRFVRRGDLAVDWSDGPLSPDDSVYGEP